MKIILIDFERNFKSFPSYRVFFVPFVISKFFAPNPPNQRKKTTMKIEERRDGTERREIML